MCGCLRWWSKNKAHEASFSHTAQPVKRRRTDPLVHTRVMYCLQAANRTEADTTWLRVLHRALELLHELPQ